MSAESRRALGFGLLAAALGITVLMLIWLATSGAEAGGVVLGLLLLFVLAGPIGGLGWYVLARGGADRLEEQAFAGKRRVLESDRLFRGELSARLRDLARTPGMPADELNRLAVDLGRGVADESAWYAAIHLDDAQIGVLAQYDDLVWEQVRWLGDHPGGDANALEQAINQLRQAIERRSDLLVRGHEASPVAPGTLLRAVQTSSPTTDIRELGLRDAVTRDGVDYVVDRLATGFANGESWKLAHLTPSGGAGTEHWLSISPGALELAWLEPVAAPVPGARQLHVDDSDLILTDVTAPLVKVETETASTPGVLIRRWRYRAGDRVGLVEQWPDESVVAYAGRSLDARELERWPTLRPEVATP